MKKIMKRAFAAVIVAVMLLTSMPMSGFSDFNWEGLLGVKASAAKVEKSDLPEDFDLKVYMADVLFRTEGQGNCMTKIKKDDGSEVFCCAHQYDRFLSLINDFQSPATTVYNAFCEDKKFVNSAEAWEAIRKTANPSNAISDLNLQQQYESLIYAVLFDSLCDEKLQKASYSNAITNVTSFTDKLIDKPRTAVMFEKTSLDLDASDELKDTALAFLSNGRDDKWASILEYNGMVAKYSGIIDKILKSATDIYNYINKISMYRALADVGADAVRVLIDMKNATSDEILKSALQSVIDSMSNDWFGIVDKVIFDVGFSVNMKAVKSLVDYGWKGCCEICPFLKGMAIGEAVGTAACNLLFATEDTIRQYEYMKMIVALENVSRPILKKYENAVKSNNNSSNAAAFWFTVDFISSLYATSANAANEMADICLSKGFVNYLIKICGGNNAERVEECKRTSSALLRNVTYNQKLIETVWENHIAEDYPQFFNKNETNSAPSKTVKSISVSPKTVYCKIGEYPSLPNITTEPANAECTYGFKSDNQDIFSDGTGFSFSQFLPTEKVGEANITVYSLEDSSVSDTFKLIVYNDNPENPDKPENPKKPGDSDIVTGNCGEDVYYTLNENSGTLYITGNGAATSCPWEKDKISKVVIADGVTLIAAGAFQGCQKLTSVRIGNSISSIGNSTFSGCTALTSISIPNSVTTIGDYAFYCCEALKNIIFGNNVISIGKCSFGKCKNLTCLVFPQSLKSIGMRAFQDCTGLANITLNNMEDIEDNKAFYSCKKLANLVVGKDVNIINDIIAKDYLSNISVETGNAFFSSKDGVLFDKQQKELVYYPKEKIDSTYAIPSTVVQIDKDSFVDCSNLTKLMIPDSVTNIDCRFWGCKKLTEVSLPCGIVPPGSVFPNSDNLRKITITSGKTGVIGEGMYYFLGKAKQLVISEGVTKICRHAFFSTSYLESVVFPCSIKEIEAAAFRYCEKLKDIVIPGDIEEIYRPFDTSETKIENIIISDGCSTIKDNFLGRLSNSYDYIKSITISSSVERINERFRCCKNLERIEVDSTNKYFLSDENGVLYNKDKTELIRFPLGSLKSEYSIPNSVESIRSYAFYGCTGLTSVTIPDSVTYIDDYAFEDCTGLANVTIGNGVTSIGDFAFENCTSLTSIRIPSSVTSIGGYAFGNCTGLIEITIGDSVKSVGLCAFLGCVNLNINITNIASWCQIHFFTSHPFDAYNLFLNNNLVTDLIIPEGVTSIDNFQDCISITSVVIPSSVTEICDAFENCINLADVYYTGSEDEWKAITIYGGNDYLKNATIHYNYKKCEHSLKHEKSPATCTLDGAEYDICSKCGAKLNVKVIAASGHKWGEWITVTPATVTASGTEKHICSVCKKEETHTVAKLTGLHDDKSGVELIYNNELGAGTQLKVEQQFSGKSFQLINSAYGEVKTSIFDIATYKNGTKVQPNGEITVKIPLPAGYSNRVFVCYVDSTNGKVTKIPCEVKDGYVIFKTNHFSEYAIVEQSANVKSVSVSDIKLNYKKSTTITPSITADDGAKYTVKYSSSNTKVATVDENGKVYAAKKGSATITCTVTDSNGNTVQDTCKLTIKYSFGQWLIKILLFGWIWY